MALPNILQQKASGNGGGATTLSFTYDTTPIEGNYLVAQFGIRGGTGVTVSVIPSGWALLRRTDNGTTVSMYTYTKYAGANEPTTHQWTFTSNKANGFVYELENVVAASPVNVENGSTNASSLSYTGITINVTSTNTRLLAAFTTAQANTAVAGANWTETLEGTAVTGGAATTRVSTQGQTRTIVATGNNTAGATWTGTAAIGANHALALLGETAPKGRALVASDSSVSASAGFLHSGAATIASDSTVAASAIILGQIAVDSTVTTVGNVGVTSSTVSHTTGSSSNRALYVIISTRFPGGSAASTGVTWNSIALTYLGRAVVQSDHSVEIWRLINPAASTTADVVATYPASRTAIVGTISLRNVNQTTSEGTLVATGASTGSPSTTLTTTPGDFVLDGIQKLTNVSLVADSPQVENYNLWANPDAKGASSFKYATGTSTTLTWTTASHYWTQAAIAVHPAEAVASQVQGAALIASASDVTANAIQTTVGAIALSGQGDALFGSSADVPAALDLSASSDAVFGSAASVPAAFAASGASDATIASTVEHTGIVSLSGSSDFVIAAVETFAAAFTFSGDSNAIFGSEGDVPAILTLSGASDFSLDATIVKSADIAYVGNSDMTQAAVAQRNAALDLSGTSDATFASTATREAALDLSGSSNAVFGSEGDVPAILSFSGTSTFSVDTSVTKPAELSLSGTSDFSVSTTNAKDSALSFDSTGTFSANAREDYVAALSFSAQGNAIFQPEEDGMALGAFAFSASSDMQTVAVGERNALFSAQGNSSFDVAAVVERMAEVNLSASSNATLNGQIDVQSALAYSASSAMTTDGVRTLTGTIPFSSTSAFDLSATMTMHAALNFAIASDMWVAVDGDVQIASLTFEGNSDILINGVRSLTSALTLDAQTDFSSIGALLRRGSLAFDAASAVTVDAVQLQSGAITLSASSSSQIDAVLDIRALLALDAMGAMTVEGSLFIVITQANFIKSRFIDLTFVENVNESSNHSLLNRVADPIVTVHNVRTMAR